LGLERLQKILSAAGICSRREAETLILEGKVAVNGKVASELGVKADPDKDVIKVEGHRVDTGGHKLYLMLNKPRGYISSTKDPEGRKTVTELMGKGFQRVYPVGRLDYDSEGLLLLTNDGDFANLVTHPSREVSKTYRVKVRGVMTDEELKKLASGVMLEDGMTAPARVKKEKLSETNSWIDITIHEGRNRQVRRMCDALGHPVLKLKRTKVGPLEIGQLEPGEFRELTKSEIMAMLEAAGVKCRDKAPARGPRPNKKTA